MKVIIGNVNLETWCRAIHGLTQIGDDEIHLDASDGILTLSTFNASMTNYATVLFFRNFFTSCEMNVTSDEPEKIAVPAKTILKPYRTLKVATNYLSSEIKFNPNEDFITVTSEVKTFVSTTYKLGAKESSSDIQFDCDPHALRNLLKAEANVFCSYFRKFDEIKVVSDLTIQIQGQRVIFKNKIPDLQSKDGTVDTEYDFTSNDFTEFEVDEESIELAFGFREFKIFASFAEQLKLPVTIRFQTPNDPAIVTVKTDAFEARLCMATRVKDPFDMSATGANVDCVLSNIQISKVVSLASGSSVEVNRRVDSVTVDAQSDDAESSAPEGPAPKRQRRMDFRVEPSVNLADDDDFMIIDQPGNPVMDIAPLVQQMEKRAKSVGYLTLQALVNAPPMTEEENLKSLPGHEQVLCPDSQSQADFGVVPSVNLDDDDDIEIIHEQVNRAIQYVPMSPQVDYSIPRAYRGTLFFDSDEDAM